MGRPTYMIIAASVLLAVPACKRSEPKANENNDAKAEREVREPVETAPPVAAQGALSPAVVELEEPGSKFTLWRFAPGEESRTVELVMRSSLGLEMGGNTIPKMVMPPLRSTFTSSLTKEDEQFRLGFQTQSMEVLDDPAANREVAAGLQHIIAGVDDLEGFVMLDERGLASRASFDVSKASSEQLEQSIQSMRQALTRLVIPLPEEAVGVGGKWTATVDDHWLGATVKQTTTYSVLSIEDDVISLAIELDMSADAQDFDFPLVPEGQTIRLVSLRGTGTGHAKFRLDQYLPIEMLTAMDTDLALSVSDARGQTQESSFQVGLGLEIRDLTKPKAIGDGENNGPNGDPPTDTTPGEKQPSEVPPSEAPPAEAP